MTEIVLKQNPAFLAWAERELEVKFNPMDAATIAVVDGRTIRAVVVFTRWSTHNVEVSIASDGSKRWFSRKLAECVFKYVFDQCKKARLTAVADSWVPEAIRLNEKLFRFEGELVDWFGEAHNGMVYGMTAAEWRAGRFRERTQHAELMAA